MHPLSFAATPWQVNHSPPIKYLCKGPEVLLAALVLLALATVLALPAGAKAPPSSARSNAPTTAGSARPQLLLIHGGSFLVNDPFFQGLTEPRALAAGFVPHYLTYPLGNMPAALRAATEEARRLREQYGANRVYAYGSSAGGTLAALLSGDGLVAAAAAKAPVSNLVSWSWPLARYGPNYYAGIGLSSAVRYRLSPVNRPQRRPLLIYQGRTDHVVPPRMNIRFAAKFKRVHLWMVPGGHTTERQRPYLITKAMGWLARVAARQQVANG
jgi:pimeloyl-ACP methyl ester carboxylesterase